MKTLFFSIRMAGVAATATADVIENVHLDFQSGAQFNGTVSFLNDFSNVDGVNGLLTGGIYGNDFINWIWAPNNDFATVFGTQYDENFLMDGTTCGEYRGSFQHFITFTWDRTNAPNIVPASPGGLLSALGGNNIDYDDPLVDGTIWGARARFHGSVGFRHGWVGGDSQVAPEGGAGRLTEAAKTGGA